jgi:N-acetyl-gamma-glutamyl-phosphate reductase
VKKVRAAIVGGTGYGGMELLRYLLDHPSVEVTAITSRTETGSVGDVHPHLRGLTDLRFTAEKAVDLAKTNDCLFFATPHGVAKKEVPDVMDASPTVKVIDLSQDWRGEVLADRKSAETQPQWLREGAYGLPECGGRAVVSRRECRFVANPGCHASSAILGLFPIAHRLWAGPANVVSVTGSSGSGATPSQGTHHPERFSNFKAYKPLQHQHEGEIALCLWVYGGAQDPLINFVPCSAPMSRGIGNVILVDLGETFSGPDEGLPDESAAFAVVRGEYERAYGNEPFVRLVPETAEVRAVSGTNFVDIGLSMRLGTLCVTVATDNLGKGMAGTAVQNLNLLFGLPETTGLRRAGAGL